MPDNLNVFGIRDDITSANALPSLDLSVDGSGPAVLTILGGQYFTSNVPTLDVSLAAFEPAAAAVKPYAIIFVALCCGFAIWRSLRKGD